MNTTQFHRTTGKFGGWLVAPFLLLMSGGCDALDNALAVETPDVIPAEPLQDPANANLLVTGTISDFDCAFGAYIVMGGMIGDELVDSSPTASRWPYDRRDVSPDDSRYAGFGCVGVGVYTPLSTARYSAENVLDNLENEWTDEEVENRTELIATAAAYSGYSNLLLGEGFCTGVLLDENLEPGGEVPREALFEAAEQRFTRAIEAAQASGSDTILNMALVGRARARLNLGNYAEAAADAELVPEGFVKVATASNTSPRRQNRIYAQTQFTEQVSVGPQYRDLTFEGEPDPRVQVDSTGLIGFDGETPIFAAAKYPDFSSPMPIATWEEAQLIIAEAELAAGMPQAAVDIINTLHARAGLPPFSSSVPAEIMDHLIQERARELFLESHRFYDIDRFELDLVPAPGTPYRTGGTFGTTRCLPLPDIETQNNPNIGG